MKTIFSILWLVWSTALYSQLTVFGVVENSQGQKIPFVSIHFENSSIGTVSNNDGVFSLKVPRHGKLSISYVGFETLNVDTRNFPGQTEIRLKESVTQLKEVSISPDFTALGLMEAAIESIPENYDGDLVTYRFYGVNEEFHNKLPAFVQEAVFDVYLKSRKYQILKLRGKYKDGYKDQFLNERTIWLGYIDFQFIEKNPESWDLKKSKLKFYDFSFDTLVNLADRPTEIIRAVPNELGRKRNKKEVHFYIDTETLAIAKAVEMAGFRHELTYRRIEDKWYVQSLVKSPQSIYNSKDRSFTHRFVVTDVLIGENNIIDPLGAKVNEYAKYRMDDWNDAFWEDYNHMVLDDIWD